MCVKFLKVYVFKGYIVRSVMIGCIHSPGSPEWWNAYINHELNLDDEGLWQGSALWQNYASEWKRIQHHKASAATVIQRFFRAHRS
jgi:uncharacterized membrane protein